MKYYIREIKRANKEQFRKYIFLFVFVIFYNVFMLNKVETLSNGILDVLYNNFKGMQYIDDIHENIVLNAYWVANNLLWIFWISSYVNNQIHNNCQKIIRVGKRKWYVTQFVVLFNQAVMFMLIQVFACFLTYGFLSHFNDEKNYGFISWQGNTFDMVIAISLLTITYCVISFVQNTLSVLLGEKIAVIITFCITIITIFVKKGHIYIGNLLMFERVLCIKNQYLFLLMIELGIGTICILLTVLGNGKRDYYGNRG